MKTRIKDLREDNDISQKTLAEYLQCNQSLYSRYESGKLGIPLDVIIKLAYFYNTNVDYLLYLTDNPNPY